MSEIVLQNRCTARGPLTGPFDLWCSILVILTALYDNWGWFDIGI